MIAGDRTRGIITAFKYRLGDGEVIRINDLLGLFHYRFLLGLLHLLVGFLHFDDRDLRSNGSLRLLNDHLLLTRFLRRLFLSSSRLLSWSRHRCLFGGSFRFGLLARLGSLRPFAWRCFISHFFRGLGCRSLPADLLPFFLFFLLGHWLHFSRLDLDDYLLCCCFSILFG